MKAFMACPGAVFSLFLAAFHTIFTYYCGDMEVNYILNSISEQAHRSVTTAKQTLSKLPFKQRFQTGFIFLRQLSAALCQTRIKMFIYFRFQNFSLADRTTDFSILPQRIARTCRGLCKFSSGFCSCSDISTPLFDEILFKGSFVFLFWPSLQGINTF